MAAAPYGSRTPTDVAARVRSSRAVSAPRWPRLAAWSDVRAWASAAGVDHRASTARALGLPRSENTAANSGKSGSSTVCRLVSCRARSSAISVRSRLLARAAACRSSGMACEAGRVPPQCSRRATASMRSVFAPRRLALRNARVCRGLSTRTSGAPHVRNHACSVSQ